MDKRAILGFVVIMALLLLWQPIWNTFFPPPPMPSKPISDTTVATSDSSVATASSSRPSAAQPVSLAPVDSAAIAEMNKEPEKLILIDTKRLRIVLSSRGGTVKNIILKDYVSFDTTSVSLIDTISNSSWGRHGALTIGYSDEIPAFNSYNFRVESPNLTLSPADTMQSVIFTYQATSGAQITKKYTFHYNGFQFDFNLDIKNPQELGLKDGITVGWFAPQQRTELDHSQDKGKLGGFFAMGGAFDSFNGLKDGVLKKAATGPVDWVANRTKYFTAVLLAKSSPGQEVVVVGSQTDRIDYNGAHYLWEQYGVGMTYNSPGSEVSLAFNIYAGPLDYDTLRDLGYGLSGLVDMGWKVFRPFAIAILWLFTSIHKFIPNYGAVIIVFSIIMKLIFWPLSQKSAKSMYKMKEIQPRLQEIKEKYKNEPAKFQQETMKAYKEFGVNPFGSCLPMLIQLPVFWALYSVLSNTIELRGAHFIFWITDLSQADPSSKYLFGLVGILPIIMGVAMFFQQKATITDPKQKMMVYLMPVIFTFLFSRWASGLVLYWTMFSLIGIFEQWYMVKNLESEKKTVSV